MCPCGRGPKVNHSKAIDDWPNDFHLGDTIYQCDKCQERDIEEFEKRQEYDDLVDEHQAMIDMYQNWADR